MDNRAQTETIEKKVSFKSKGLDCQASLYLPSEHGASFTQYPTLIMAHGFGASRNFRLPEFAKRFAAEGFACLVFDYRNFGESEGEPRNWVSPRRHQQDWRAALEFARTLPEIDPDRIVLWGTSYSGGHVLQIASEQPKIAGAIAQVPFVSGLGLIARTPIGRSLKFTLASLMDIVGGIFGKPHYIQTVGRVDEFAAMNTEECWDGWHALVPEGAQWENKVLARAFFTLPFFNPTFVAHKILAPTFVVAGKEDSITPWSLTKKAVDKIPNATFKSMDCNHFAPYVGDAFEENIAAQITFLKKILAR